MIVGTECENYDTGYFVFFLSNFIVVRSKIQNTQALAKSLVSKITQPEVARIITVDTAEGTIVNILKHLFTQMIGDGVFVLASDTTLPAAQPAAIAERHCAGIFLRLP